MKDVSPTECNQAAQKSIKLTLLVQGNKLRVTGLAGEPRPLIQTPPLSIRAADDLDFALVGDAKEETYRLFQFDPNNPRKMTDLGPTGHRYVATAPEPPRAVVVLLDIKPPRIVPRLEGHEPKELDLEQLATMQLSFGIASQCPYWVACNHATHMHHLYRSDMLGAWEDLGHIPDTPC